MHVTYNHGSSVEFCEAIPIGLFDESKESLYGRRTCVAPRQHVDARHVVFILFSPNEQQRGGGGGCAAGISLLLHFPY